MTALEDFKTFSKSFILKRPDAGFARAAATYAAARVETVAGSPPPGAAKTLLALNPGRFRGDLEILARSGFRVLTLPFDVTTRLWRLAYDRDDLILEAERPEAIAQIQEAFRRFLVPLLERFYAKVPVDAVLGAAVHYRHEHDWCAVSQTLGAPFLVLHRENLVASDGVRRRLFERMRGYRPFEGASIAVHNPLMRDLFVQSGYADSGRVHALGALRMDPWLEHARAPNAASDEAPTIAFFSFGPAAGVIGAPRPQWPPDDREYMREFCRRTHVAVLEFAAANPNVRVVVKPKWGGDWPERLEAIWREHGLEKPVNLVVDPAIDPQRLMLESRAVIAFNSTVLLEAGILGKPVILPLFDEAAEERWREFIMFHGERAAFDVAQGPEELKSLMSSRVADGVVSNSQMELRRRLFAAYVSPLEGGAVERYRAWIDEATSRERPRARVRSA